MTLYCHETPRLLSVAHHKLCAAFHEPATASYNIVVFKTTQKSEEQSTVNVLKFDLSYTTGNRCRISYSFKGPMRSWSKLVVAASSVEKWAWLSWYWLEHWLRITQGTAFSCFYFVYGFLRVSESPYNVLYSFIERNCVFNEILISSTQMRFFVFAFLSSSSLFGWF